MLFDRICRENGIKHILTAPRSSTTTGKVERWYRILRAEFLTGKVFASVEAAQAQLDVWSSTTTTSGRTSRSGWSPRGNSSGSPTSTRWSSRHRRLSLRRIRRCRSRRSGWAATADQLRRGELHGGGVAGRPGRDRGLRRRSSAPVASWGAGRGAARCKSRSSATPSRSPSASSSSGPTRSDTTAPANTAQGTRAPTRRSVRPCQGARPLQIGHCVATMRMHRGVLNGE